MQPWSGHFLEATPLYAPLRLHGAGVAGAAGADWPTLPSLQALLDARGVICGAGLPLTLMPQAKRVVAFEERYEVRTFLRGELQVRERNWHDLFNVLSWLTYPRAKAALNARHYAAAVQQRDAGGRNRGVAQDAFTLFDEGGMIVASSDAALLDDLTDFAWKRLFVTRRARAIRHMQWRVFGHALFEKALDPYIGVTGRGLLLIVDDAFHGLAAAEQLSVLDQRVAALIADPAAFGGARDLTPVPVLGVPGVWPANEDAGFYDNADYFRAKKDAARTA